MPYPRLPSRAEWERSAPAGEVQAARRPVRYSARDLESKRVDPGNFKQGRLLLMLLLNERLAADEDLQALARVLDNVRYRWMIVTTERVLFVLDELVSDTDLEVTSFEHAEIAEPTARRGMLRSRIDVVVGGERKQLKVRGRNSAKQLLEHIRSDVEC